MTFILNQSFEQGIFPEILKDAQATPIFKKEYTLPVSSYRIIPLLSNFSKSFEEAMYHRIYSFPCKNKVSGGSRKSKMR